MLTTLASIIIPIYNSESYLSECISSALSQTMSSLEIILIDDGSTDGSLEICNRFSQGDSRIKVISQENGGISSARNLGILNAKGKYIYFLDSDDYIDQDMLQYMVELAEKRNVDICSCGFKKVDDHKNILYNQNYPLKSEVCILKNEIQEYLKISHYKKMLWYVWRNIYRRDLLIENNLWFEEKLKFAEDSIFNLKAYFYANSMIATDKSFYNYRKNIDSLTSRKGRIDLTHYLELQYQIKKEFYRDNGFSEIAYKDLAISVVEHSLPKMLYNHRSIIYHSKKEKYLGLLSIYKLNMVKESLQNYKLTYLFKKSRGIKAIVMLSKFKLYFIINSIFIK